MQVYVITEGECEDTTVVGVALTEEEAYRKANEPFVSGHHVRDIWGPHQTDGKLFPTLLAPLFDRVERPVGR